MFGVWFVKEIEIVISCCYFHKRRNAHARLSERKSCQMYNQWYTLHTVVSLTYTGTHLPHPTDILVFDPLQLPQQQQCTWHSFWNCAKPHSHAPPYVLPKKHFHIYCLCETYEDYYYVMFINLCQIIGTLISPLIYKRRRPWLDHES